MDTKEDISSLLVPDAKFQEEKSDCLGQLTPEMGAKKIVSLLERIIKRPYGGFPC